MQDRRTDSRTAGDTDSGNGLHRGQQEGGRTGQRETVTDRGQGQQDRSGERERERTATRDYSRTGGIKRTSTVIVMQ